LAILPSNGLFVLNKKSRGMVFVASGAPSDFFIRKPNAMRHLLIQAILCLVTAFLHAQTPSSDGKKQCPPLPEGACWVGTFSFGPILGQSNDNVPDTIFLCSGDTMCIHHNGDAIFMDPDPVTPPGIGFALYRCPPTKDGDDMAVLSDSCLWPGAAGTGFWMLPITQDDNLCLINNGNFVNSPIFGQGNHAMLTFAPITVTDYPVGLLEPGCVDVGIIESFSVVYLKPVEMRNLSIDGCMGGFRVRGGYPEWDNQGVYTIRITLDSDSSVQAIIHTPPAERKPGEYIEFTVPQPGTYLLELSDAKSCRYLYEMDIFWCIPLSQTDQPTPGVAQACSILPNPVRIGNQLILQIESIQSTPAVLSILDATGKPVLKQSRQLNSGKTSWEIPTESFPAGIYTALLHSEISTLFRQFVVIN